MPNDICIKVNQVPFFDWNNLCVRKDLEELAGCFSFNLIKKNDNWPIKVGDHIQILIGSTSLIFGYVDAIYPDLSSTDRQIEVSGRDNTSDLIDCSHTGSKREFKTKQSVLSVFKEILYQFNIDVKCELTPVPIVENIKIDPGETVFEVLEKIARKLGLILQSSGSGDLVITKISTEYSNIQLKDGIDFLESYSSFNHENCFSHYILKGHDVSHKPIKVELTDSDIKRYRPLEIINSGVISEEEAKKKLKWELTVRQARATEFFATVQGWTINQKPWMPNHIYKICAPSNGIKDELLLLKSCEFYFNEEGTTTELSFSKAEAFKLEPKIRATKNITHFGYGR